LSIETEQKIKSLLRQALAAKDAEDVERVLGELRKALDEHIWHAKVSLASQASLIQSETPQADSVQKKKKPFLDAPSLV
jgi:hypothetical protein